MQAFLGNKEEGRFNLSVERPSFLFFYIVALIFIFEFLDQESRVGSEEYAD